MSAAARRLLLLTLLLGSTADSSPADDLSNAFAKITDRPEFREAHWGWRIVDLKTGETLHEHQPDQLFAPASVTKLYSVAAALDAFGADHRFETPVYARGELTEAGVLNGDLILRAQGDLSFGGRTDEHGRIAFQNVDHTYATPTNVADWTAPDPLAGLKDLARQIAKRVKHVRGEVAIDDRLYEHAESTGSGPRRLTPIMINDNLLDVRVTPAAEVGRPAIIEYRPQGTMLHVDAQVDTAKADAKPELFVRWTEGGVIVRGTVPFKGATRVVGVEAGSPALWARSLFIDCLRSAGVKVNASPLWAQSITLPNLPDYRQMKPLAMHVSPPFRESAKLILKVSHNLQASTLPLLLAAKHGQGTLDDGLRLQQQFLAKAGVDVETISFGGGAGGDRADYTTPAATVKLLQFMAEHRDAAAYRAALPILGVDGTLAKAVAPDSPARGKVFAKTGTYTLNNRLNRTPLMLSKALGGYAECASGRQVVFALFVNLTHLNDKRTTATVGSELGQWCEAMVKEL